MDWSRGLLFLVGCIGARAAVAVAAALVDEVWLRRMGFAALLPVAGWLWIMLVRPRDRGLEAPGGRIWWQPLRPLHAALWLAFAVAAVRQDRRAYHFLLADTALGLGAWVAHHYTCG